MCRIVSGIIVAMMLFCVRPGMAEFSPEIDLAVGNEIIDGFTQYELKFVLVSESNYKAYGNSRLKYPFHNSFSGGELQISEFGLAFNFGYWQDYKASKDETMMDFDWITSTENQYILLAYGETTPNTEIYYYTAGLKYDIKFLGMEFGPFFDYHKYHSEFIMNDLHQLWYIDTETGEDLDPPWDTTIAGNVLYYEQDLKMPIMGINFGVSSLMDRVDIFSKIGFTWFASVDDFDDHVIRTDSLESRNSGDEGEVFLFELSTKVDILESLALIGTFSYLDYNINCQITQRYIDEEIEDWVTATARGAQVRGVMRKFNVSVAYMFNF